MEQAQNSDYVGKLLGPYQILEKIGEGGMGTVYRARDTGLDRDVAIKTLPSRLTASDEYKERFLREARALAKVKHPNLVQIYSVSTTDDLYYFAMEYIKGDHLGRLARGGNKMSHSDILRIAGQSLSALASVHRVGILHRDIKSANIMIAEDGAATLMDLGLAKDEYVPGVTAEGTILGTPEYMSPEQAEGHEPSKLSDIYAFGIVLYEMAAGEVPFMAKSALAVLRMHAGDTPRPLAEIRPDLSAEFINAVEAALTKDPSKRVDSTEELAKLLLKAGSTPELEELASLSGMTRPTIMPEFTPENKAPHIIADASISNATSPTIIQGDDAIPSQTTHTLNAPAQKKKKLRKKKLQKKEHDNKKPYLIWSTAALLTIILGVLIASLMGGKETPQAADAKNPPPPVKPELKNAAQVSLNKKLHFKGERVEIINIDKENKTITVRHRDGKSSAIPLDGTEFIFDTPSSETP